MPASDSDRLAWLLAAFFVAAQVPFLLQPIGRVHKWRQADAAAVSRNLAFESADIRYPRIDVRGDRTGITGMEFPAYQAAVAILMRAFDSRADWIGKAIALGASLLAWVALVTFMVRRFGINPWSAGASLAVSPMLFNYGSRFMPETFALMCACISLERFDAWWDQRRAIQLACALGTVALAALVRPFVIFLGLPMAVGAVVLVRNRSRAVWALVAGGLLALLPFVAWYFWWDPRLVRQFGIDYFFMGSPVRQNLAAMASAKFWSKLGWVICQEYVSWQLLPLFILGAWTFWGRSRGREDRWLWLTVVVGVPVLALTVLLLLTGQHFSPHTYYLFGILPPVAVCLAMGFDGIRVRWPKAFPVVVGCAVLLLPLTLAYQYEPESELTRYAAVLPDVAKKVASSDLVIVEDRGGYAWHLHPLRRRGWVEPRSRLEDVHHMAELASRGCRWVVYDSPTGYRLAGIRDWLGSLGSDRADIARSSDAKVSK